MQENFRRHFIYLQRMKGQNSKMLYQSILNLIYEPDPHKFQEIQELIFSSTDLLDETKLQYLRSLFAIKEKWAAAYCPNIFNANTHTVSRAESVNSQIKNRVFAKSSMCDILRLFQELEDRSINKIITFYKTHQKQILHHPLLQGIYDYYSNYAFEKMLYQYMNSHHLVVKRLVQNEFDDTEQITITNAQLNPSGQYVVKDDEMREKCMVYLQGKRHSFFLMINKFS